MVEGATRRMFLRTTGGAALGIPFLASLLPRGAKAGTIAPKRFIAMQSQSGQFVGDFWPSSLPAGYQLRDLAYGGDHSDGTTAVPDPIAGHAHGHRGALTDFVGTSLSPVLGDWLQPWYDKMNLVRGLDYLQATSHGTGQMLGNYANCASGGEFSALGLGWMPTIDQVLAYSDKFYGNDPRSRSIVMTSGAFNSTISDSDYGIAGGPVDEVPGYIEPLYLFEDLFGDFMDPEMPAEHPNRKLVNAIYDDYVRLRQNTRLSAADRQMLERHMSFIDDLEQDLSQTLVGCNKPEEPEFHDVGYPYQEVASVDGFERRCQQLVDVSVAAIMCDLSRIATFQLQMAVSDAGTDRIASYHSSDDSPGDWHDFAHDATDDASDHAHIVALNRWCGEVIFKRFLERLDVEEAGGKTYLDNSLVYWGGELSINHYVFSLPTVLAGGAGGSIATGNYFDYTNFDHGYANPAAMPWGVRIPGEPHNRLLVTILQAMGLSPTDYERDGLSGYGHDTRFGQPNALAGDGTYDLSQIGNPLPGLFNG